MKLIYKILILCLILVINFETKAQNFNDALRLSFPGLGIGARALGMGSAFTAVSDDYTASYWNPAGLFQIKRMEFSGGLNYQNFSNKATFFGNETSYDNSTTNLNNIGFVFPFPTVRGSMVFAMGYERVNNFNSALSFDGYNPGNTSMIQTLLGKGDISYLLYLTDSTGNYTPINGRLNQSGTILSSGTENHWSLSGAIEVAKDLAVGINISILSGSFERSRDYTEEDTKNVYPNSIRTDPADQRTADFERFMFNETLKWDLSGFNAKVGLMYRYKDLLRFGAMVKFPSSFTIKEEYLVDGTAEFGTGFSPNLGEPLTSKIEYDIITPYQFSSGLSVTRYGLTLAGDVNFIDYTQMEFDNLDASLTVRNNKDIKELFKTVMDFSLGAEYEIFDTGLKVRGGFFVKHSPFKNDPSDFDRKYFTVGAGFITDNAFAFDLAYVRGWWKNIGDNYGSNVSRTYQDIKTNDFLLTISYRF